MALSSYQRGLSNITLKHGYDGHRGVRAKATHARKKPAPRSAKENPRTTAPEIWYNESDIIKPDRKLIVIQQDPGLGFRHAVTVQDVRERIEELGCMQYTRLERVQLSQMTNKRYKDPSYGMQWGTTIYLYPIEEELQETYTRPPDNLTRLETVRYGATWEEVNGEWVLKWGEAQNVKDFYLLNVLPHEVGHMFDIRNTTYDARERFANAFAYQHGERSYLASKGKRPAVKRHHS